MFVLVCSGQLFRLFLESPHKPAVIKPNNEELSQLLEEKFPQDLDELKRVLQDPLFGGVRWLSFLYMIANVVQKHRDYFL